MRAAPAAAPAPAPQAARRSPARRNAEDDNWPEILVEQIRYLEEWAQDNRRDSRRDLIRFWALKIPAILFSASAGALTYFNLQAISIIMGAVASLCVLVDSLNPGGMLRNIHYKAFHDLRQLQHDIKTEWMLNRRRATDAESEHAMCCGIIEKTQPEIKRIANYLKNAETSLGAKPN